MDSWTQFALIAIQCVFLMIVILVDAGCVYLHFKLKAAVLSPNNCLKKDMQPCTIETRDEETRITLSPSPVLTISQQPSPKPPPQLPSRQLLHLPHCLSPPSPEDTEYEESGLLLVEEILSITNFCWGYSSENSHFDSDTSAYSLDHYQLEYLSSRSTSQESPQCDIAAQVTKDHEESNDSGSFVLHSVCCEK